MVHCRGVESALVAGSTITLTRGVVAGLVGRSVVAGARRGTVAAAAVIVIVALVAAFEGVEQALEWKAG